MTPLSERRHATTIAINGRGVMIEGASGSGKSDLALRLIDRGAMLVSDDYTDFTVVDGRLTADPPATIAGRIEVRGIGIVALPHVAAVPIALHIALVNGEVRMPEPATLTILGVSIAHCSLMPFPATAPIKVELALRNLA